MKVDVVLTEADIAQEFAEALEGRDLPEKFFYWFPRSAHAWAALTSDTALYGGLWETWHEIARDAPALAKHIAGHVPVISFGAGDGARDRLLLEALKAAGRECVYSPVDASISILEMACAGGDDQDIETLGIKADISSPVHLVYAADAAEAMRPLAGDYAFILFAFGLFNASLFAASILPISTAYTVCEGLGFESGVDKSFKEAPFFYWLYSLLIAGGAITVLLLPDAQLINVAILSQVLNGVLLPVVIILMLMLINRQDLMGEHKNSRLWNVIAWGTSIIVIGMTLVMLWGMIPGH